MMKGMARYAVVSLGLIGLFGIWLLWRGIGPSSKITHESPKEMVQRAEQVFACRFPTNYRVLNHGGWIRKVPRCQDRRIGVLHFETDQRGWVNLRSSLLEKECIQMEGKLPDLDNYGSKLGENAPWLSVVQPGWIAISGQKNTYDPNGWPRVNWVEVYAMPAEDKTNREIVAVFSDLLSEVK